MKRSLSANTRGLLHTQSTALTSNVGPPEVGLH